ncbi:hypothetical protein EWB00_002786, partial [Schistosoma japonicum]
MLSYPLSVCHKLHRSPICFLCTDLHNKSNSLLRLSKNVSFIPSMPCFDNYPLNTRTLDNTEYFMHSSILKSPSRNHETSNRQHLYQFKSHPNIPDCTNNLVDHLHYSTQISPI